MYFLYGKRRNGILELVAKFGAEQQLLAYVRYATLRIAEDGVFTFEQKTPLTGCVGFEYSTDAKQLEEEKDVPLNPSPTML